MDPPDPFPELGNNIVNQLSDKGVSKFEPFHCIIYLPPLPRFIVSFRTFMKNFLPAAEVGFVIRILVMT